MKQLLGVGIRGTGQVAIEHVKAIDQNPYTEVVAICGRNFENAKRFAAHYAPKAKVYQEYESMLGDSKVDIVSECMPNYLHAKEAILALEADKHVILEKPAGITAEETEALRAAAQQSDRKSVVSFVLRWHPMVQHMRSLVENNHIGEVYYAEADYWHGISSRFNSYEWIRRQKYAGGAMITGGSHAVDVLRFLHGEIVEVSAYATKKRDDFDYLTTCIAAVKFADGSVGKVSASLDGLHFPYQFNIDLLGTEGACRDNKLYSRSLFPNQDRWIEHIDATPNSGAVTHHPYQDEIDNLIDGIRNDVPILSDIEDACKSMMVVHAIDQSVREGKPIHVKG